MRACGRAGLSRPLDAGARRCDKCAVPWLLAIFGVGIAVVGLIEPSNLMWVVVLLPLWLVLIPTLFPPVERKVAKVAADRRAKRVAVARAREAAPGDTAGGVSVPDPGDSGALALSDDAAGDTSDLPSTSLDGEALMALALALMVRHFAALNAGDEAAFRETAYLFDANDGAPFARWWTGMRSLAPLAVTLTPGWVTRRIATKPAPHLSIWVTASAWSDATRQRYDGDFVVFYLLDAGTVKLGCRLHWWLADAPTG